MTTAREQGRRVPHQRRERTPAQPFGETEHTEHIASWLLHSGGQISEVAAITMLHPGKVARLAPRSDRPSSGVLHPVESGENPDQEQMTNPVVIGFARELIGAGLMCLGDAVAEKIKGSKHPQPGIAARVIETAHGKVKAVTAMEQARRAKEKARKEEAQQAEDDGYQKKDTHKSAAEEQYYEIAQPYTQETTRSLFEQHHEKVWAYVLRRMADRPLAEDLTQDTFVRISKKVGDNPGVMMDPENDGGPWVVTIARNLVLDHVKTSRYRLEQSVGDIGNDVGHSQSTPSAEGEVINAEIAGIIWQAVAGLKPEQQEIVIRRMYADQSIREIAEEMELNVGAVKGRQHRAIRKLVGMLGDESLAEVRFISAEQVAQAGLEDGSVGSTEEVTTSSLDGGEGTYKGFSINALQSLTPAQEDVFLSFMEGAEVEDIARELDRSPDTVREHLKLATNNYRRRERELREASHSSSNTGTVGLETTNTAVSANSNSSGAESRESLKSNYSQSMTIDTTDGSITIEPDNNAPRRSRLIREENVLLGILAEKPGVPVSADEFRSRAKDGGVDLRSLDKHFQRMRHALEGTNFWSTITFTRGERGRPDGVTLLMDQVKVRSDSESDIIYKAPVPES